VYFGETEKLQNVYNYRKHGINDSLNIWNKLYKGLEILKILRDVSNLENICGSSFQNMESEEQVIDLSSWKVEMNPPLIGKRLLVNRKSVELRNIDGWNPIPLWNTRVIDYRSYLERLFLSDWQKKFR
jgi:hypothetical protein